MKQNYYIKHSKGEISSKFPIFNSDFVFTKKSNDEFCFSAWKRVIFQQKRTILNLLMRINCSGPSYFLPPTNEVYEGYVFTGVCQQGGLCPGGGSLSRGVSVRETPPYGYLRAVRILLECILVLHQPVDTYCVFYCCF